MVILRVDVSVCVLSVSYSIMMIVISSPWTIIDTTVTDNLSKGLNSSQITTQLKHSSFIAVEINTHPVSLVFNFPNTHNMWIHLQGQSKSAHFFVSN